MTNDAVQRNETDCRLVKLAQEGSSQALDELFERYKNVIHIILRKRVFDRRLHEDMQQEAHMALVRAIENFELGRSSFLTYASKVIDNALVSASRSGQSVQADSTSKEDGEEIEIPSHHDVEGEVVQNIMNEELRAYIEQGLSESERTAYLLSIQGYSNIEIAAIQGVQIRSIANALARARKKIESVTQ